MYSKLHLSIGNKEIDVKLSGINKINQIHTMKGLIISFFDELEAEATADEKKLLEEREMRFLSSTLGIEEENLTSMMEAYNEIASKNRIFSFSEETDTPEENKVSEAAETNETETNIDFSSYKAKKVINEIHFKKDTPTSKEKFQTYYICPDCRFKGKYFAYKDTVFIHCKECGKKMNVKPAASGPFPHTDKYGNVYIAGKFIRADQYEPTILTMAQKEEIEKKFSVESQ